MSLLRGIFKIDWNWKNIIISSEVRSYNGHINLSVQTVHTEYTTGFTVGTWDDLISFLYNIFKIIPN